MVKVQAKAKTHCSKFDRAKVRYKDFWVDVFQVPGEVLALQGLSEFQTIRYVTKSVLLRQTDSIIETVFAVKQTNKIKHTKLNYA